MSRGQVRWVRRWWVVLVLVALVMGAFLIDLTAPTVHGQQKVAGEEHGATSLAFVPRDTLALVVFRPATLLQRPVLEPVADRLTAMADDQLKLAIAPQEVTSFSAWLLGGDRREVGVCLRLEATTPEAAQRFAASLGEEAVAKSFAGQPYQQLGRRMFVFMPDNRTVIFSPEEAALRRCLSAGRTGATTTKWAEPFASVAESDGAAVVNTAMLRGALTIEPVGQILRELNMVSSRNGGAAGPYTAMQVAPIWQRSEYAIAELHAEDDILFRVVSQSATEDEAKQVHSALLTTISIVRMGLSQGRHAVVADEKPGSVEMLGQIDLLDEVLENAVVARREAQVGMVARASKAVTGRAVQMLAPTIAASREASYRRQSMNNLKQIAIAFHNYHDTYKTLPAAVQIGPKDVPHSWRVTILPFIEQGSLYDEYRQDEPWDSEHNKALLAKMPSVYRFPGDSADTVNAAYFGFIGPTALFEENHGPKFRDILDGLSNTLLVVESKRDVPWTKPEEIPFDPDGPLPPVGGWYAKGFHGAMCDGSVRFFSDDLDEQTFRNLIMRADGNPVKLPRP